MANEVFDKDLTNFESFLNEYVDELKKDYNKIIKVRDCSFPFNEKLTIKNPKLIFNNEHELAPRLSISPLKTYTFFITRHQDEQTRTAVYIKVTKYEEDNYKNSGLTLSFSVVNKILAVVESINNEGKMYYKREDINILKMAQYRNKMFPFSSHLFDLIQYSEKFSGLEIDNLYYSDKDWDDRLKYKYISFYPLVFLSEILTGDTFHKCSYNPLKHEDPELSPLVSDKEDIIHEKYEVYFRVSDPYSLLWLSRDDNVLREFIDTKLLKFLCNHEFPILASISSNSLARPIKNNELKFINETLVSLLKLKRIQSNIITELAVETSFMIVSALTEFKVLSNCKYCGLFMRYRYNKKFCSTSSEGRSCGKNFRNKKYYNKNQNRLSKYYREEMRKTRAFIRNFNQKQR